MRVPLSWLRDFAPIDGEPGALADDLNELGLIVEAVERVGEGLDNVVTARVLETRPHPNADKVQLVDVDTGNGEALQIVCGAFNFSVGDVVPLATIGATLPNGLTIARRKVRGEWSNGMLCAADELGFGSDHSGIMQLDPNLELGTELAEALGIERDVVFDLEITPNRPDAMSIAGVARDLAARRKVPFSIPEPPEPQRGDGPTATLRVEATDLCPRFTAQVLTGVAVGSSPRWMGARLTLAGMRPINALVDISNYVMLELGQPNHAYDLDRLPGGGLSVRRGRVGEVVVTLDDVARTVGEEDCLICDAEGEPVGIGAIMGGASSEISERTTNVLLETAYFDPMSIARSSKRLGLRTEASARFERGIDRGGIERAVHRFCQLAADITGASVAGPLLADGVELPPAVTVAVRTARINGILGTELADADVRGYLEPIGFTAQPAGSGVHDVTIPTWRPDSEREIDVVEEVGRHHGYPNVARTVPPNPRVGRLTPYQKDRRRVRDIAAGTGLSEAWTNSLVAPADIELAGLDPSAAVGLANPMVKEESVLRTSLLPGLLRAVAYNAAHRQPDVRLFEVGHVFGQPPPGTERPAEVEHLGGALGGAGAEAAARVWHAIVEALGATELGLESGEVPGLHPTRTARIVHLPTGGAFGAVGEVDPDVVAAHDLAGPVGWFHVDLEWLLALPRRTSLYQPISRFPSSDIDLAFVVKTDVPAAAVEATLRAAAGELLADVWLFDVYRDERLGADRRSLAFRLRFEALDRTLTDQEVAEIRGRAIDAVTAGHSAELRG